MTKYCPDCGEELVERINSEDGEKFLGCSSFPDCKYTEEIEEDDTGFDERREQIKQEKRFNH